MQYTNLCLTVYICTQNLQLGEATISLQIFFLCKDFFVYEFII